MRSSVLNAVLLLATVLSVPGASFAQEVAGRILVSVGDVTLLRGGQSIPAPAGTQVLAGDTINLGERSNAQVRFTDESIVALRPDTTFRITEYRFRDQKPETQSAFFNLLKGGMRTVSGLIGKVEQKNYGVTTPTSTIGIRGTNYSLVQCDANCRNPDGSVAPAGTYGGVTDGRIAVTNQSGEQQFGANEYFHVASQAAAPTQLIAPPSFLRDTLEGRSRREGRPVFAGGAAQQAPSSQAGQPAATSTSAGTQTVTTVAQTGIAGAGDTQVTSTTVTSTAAPVVLNTTVVPVTTTFNTTGPSTIVQPTTTGTIFYRAAGTLNVPVLSCSGSGCGTVTSGDITLGVNLVAQRATLQANFVVSSSGSPNFFNVSVPINSGGIPITTSGSQITFSGTANRVDYPTQQGPFRCFGCANSGTTSSTPGFLDTISVSGTISGSTATLNLSGSSATGGSGSFAVTLAQQTPPNSLGAATIIPYFSTATGGNRVPDASAFSYWGVSADSSGKLLSFGPSVGARMGSVGTATNTLVGSDSTAYLTWGTWGSGAQITDFNYNSYTFSSSTLGGITAIPWITGQITNTLPATLGSSVTYSPIASLLNSGTVLNSASLTADFVNRAMSLSINATRPGNTGGTATFQLNGTSALAVSSGRFGAGFSTISCTGSCTNTTGAVANGNFGGFFAGPNAEGAGVSFAAGYGSGGVGVGGVMAMKR